MHQELKEKRIAELYLTAEYSMKALSVQYKLSSERVSQILRKRLGSEVIKDVKFRRKMIVAERMKEEYIKNICK